MTSKSLIITSILILAAGGGGFFAGFKYQQSRSPSRADLTANRQFGGANGRQGPAGALRAGGAPAVRGEIIEASPTSLTVKLPDESTKIILISDNTAINKADQATVDDLKVGESVSVFGQINSDSSVSATSIQLGTGLGPRGNASAPQN